MNKSDRLGIFDCICLMVGVVVGAGIFETTPTIAAQLSSETQVYLFWAIGGLLSLCGAICYAELVTAFPKDSGEYEYLKQAFSEKIAFVFSWSKILIVRPGSIAAMSFPFASYFLSFLSEAGLKSTAPSSGQKIVVATLIIVGFSLLNCFQIKANKLIQNLFSISKVLGLVFIISLVFLTGQGAGTSSITTELPSASGAGLALILILFTYGGWSELAYVASSVDNPGKNITRALVLGIVSITLIYIAINWAFISALSLETMSNSKSVATDAVASALPGQASVLVSLLVCLALAGAVEALVFTGARLTVSFAEEYPKLAWFANRNSKNNAPVSAILFQALVSITLVLILGSFNNTLIYTTSVVWIFYLLTALAIPVLRKSGKINSESKQIALYPLPVILFSLSSAYLIYSAMSYDFKGSIVSLILTASGLPAWHWLRSNR